ncbi:MAG: phosphate/phosphite/phosphonate ABC transporter substrate-binding protein [Gammaproteobacteria bacterium]|nr:phosphate/phosphite/phosphonate ABC transporter substrate-binding protein [Gammaproteobacteria bacterium]
MFKKIASLALSCVLLVPGSGSAEQDNLPVYKFGVTPWQHGQQADDIRARYKPMMDWLGNQVGAKFIIIEARDYDQGIEYLANGVVHFAHVSPVPYVRAKNINPNINILVTGVRWNKDRTQQIDSYLGHFVTLKRRDDLNSITDLKGSRFGFVDKDSSSGYKYPVAELKKKGIDYTNYFRKFYFLGSHPRLTDAVAAGSIDAGATWDFNLKEAIAKHGDIFKIIHTTPPIPNLNISAHPSMPREMQLKIRRALTKIDKEALKLIMDTGYVVRPDEFYDVVRDMTGVRRR